MLLLSWQLLKCDQGLGVSLTLTPEQEFHESDEAQEPVLHNQMILRHTWV